MESTNHRTYRIICARYWYYHEKVGKGTSQEWNELYKKMPPTARKVSDTPTLTHYFKLTARLTAPPRQVPENTVADTNVEGAEDIPSTQRETATETEEIAREE